jgi:hypothetical protein
MSLALDIQVASFRLASDNQNVVKNILQGNKGVYGQIVQEINARRSAFASVEFMHEKRTPMLMLIISLVVLFMMI